MLGSDIRRRPAWRDQWFLLAVALALATFAASEVGASMPIDVDLRPTLTGGLRLLTLLFALLGGAAVLEREAARRLRSEREAAAARAEWEERAHEARTALSTIELAMYSVARHQPDASRWQTLADVVRSEVAHLHRLLDRDGATPEAADFAVAAALADAVAAARLRGQHVTCAVPAGLRAHGSPRAVAEIAANLLENAARHAPGAAVRITGRRRGPAVAIRIEDDGPGVPAELAHRVFERGAGRAGGGTGLGLFIARRLAANEGGSLELARQHGGAAFELTVPASRMEALADVA